jgi:ubiquinone/menaquinone biosynthesis C-methylase UbiE
MMLEKLRYYMALIRESRGRRGELYDDSYWGLNELDNTAATKTIMEWLDPKEGERILDVGCGTGRFMEAIERSGAECIGIEKFQFPLEKARPRVKGLLYQMSAEELSFPDGSFDKSIVIHVIEHLEHPEKCFSEIRRVLKLKGILVLSFPNSNYLPFRLGILKQSPTHLQKFNPSLQVPGFNLSKSRVFRLGYNVVMSLERQD